MMHIVRGESPISPDHISEEEALVEAAYSKVYSSGRSIVKQEFYRKNKLVRVSYWEVDESCVRARVALHLGAYHHVPFRIYIGDGRFDDGDGGRCLGFNGEGILESV